MKSSNCSLTFFRRAGVIPGWLRVERGLIQALRRLYRLTHIGQLGLKRSSACPRAAQLEQPCSAPLQLLGLRDLTHLAQVWVGCQKSESRDTPLRSAPANNMGMQGVGVIPLKSPHLNPVLLSTSSLPRFPANYSVSGVSKAVSYSTHKHFLFYYC